MKKGESIELVEDLKMTHEKVQGVVMWNNRMVVMVKARWYFLDTGRPIDGGVMSFVREEKQC